MKFLIEYNKFNNYNGSFNLSRELIDDIKESLSDYLEYVVEDKIPNIKEGKISPNFALNRLYVYESTIYKGDEKMINAVFINQQDYNISLEHLSKIIKNIDESLICISTHNSPIVICKKKIIDMFEGYKKLSNACENVISEIIDGYGRWQKWKTSFIIDFEEVKSNEVSFTIQKDYPGALGNVHHPKLEVTFFIPNVSHWQHFNDITFDIYFEVQKPKKHKDQFNSDPEIENVKSKLELTTNLFIYEIKASQKQVESDLSDWIESEILIYFENDFSRKFDRLKTILKSVEEIELDYDEDFDVVSNFEVLAKYKSFEMILNFLYDFETDKIKIFDEFDKLLDECPLEDLKESLFLIMTENR